MAVHLRQDYQENLRTTKNTDFEKVKQLFDISEYCFWMRTTLLHDQAVKLSKAKVHVYSDSVLCLGRIHEYPQAIEAWTQNTHSNAVAS